MKKYYPLLFCISFMALILESTSAFANISEQEVTPNAFFKSKKTALRCFYRQDASNLAPETDYEWAIDPNSRNGSKYKLKGYWSSDLGILTNMFYTETTADELLAVCNYTLKVKNIDAPLAMYAAGNTDISFNYTIWNLDPVRQSGHINKIVAFGDSLSDTQNMLNATEWLLPVKKNYYAGRFSNGKNWLDYLSESLNLPVYNWAVGGAGVGNRYVGLLHGIKTQVKSWVAYTTKELATNYRPENTLFTMLIGANDLISYKVAPSEIIAKEKKALEIVIANGGKNILVLNLPDLASAPIYKYKDEKKAEKVSAQVLEYNAGLANLVHDLQVKHRDINIQLFDTYAFQKEVMANKEAYHITNTEDSCLDLRENAKINYIKSNKISAECANSTYQADEYIFWDVEHPTSHMHSILANKTVCFIQQKFASKFEPQKLNPLRDMASLPVCSY